MLISYHVKQKEPPKLHSTLSPATDIRTTYDTVKTKSHKGERSTVTKDGFINSDLIAL
jgi:hypothetical protein